MRQFRNAVIVIILCLIGGYDAYKPAGKGRPALGILPLPDSLHDSVAGSGVAPTDASNPNLHLSNNDEDQIHDSVAGNAVPGFGPNGNQPGGPNGGTNPPRGATDGGFGSFSQQNPNSQIAPSPLSQSGPSSPSAPPQ
jgi:hypothetical protein